MQVKLSKECFIERCQLCEGPGAPNPARWDAQIAGDKRWAYMCHDCFVKYATGTSVATALRWTIDPNDHTHFCTNKNCTLKGTTT